LLKKSNLISNLDLLGNAKNLQTKIHPVASDPTDQNHRTGCMFGGHLFGRGQLAGNWHNRSAGEARPASGGR